MIEISEEIRSFPQFQSFAKANLEIRSPILPEFGDENEKFFRFFPFSSEGKWMKKVESLKDSL